MAETKQNIFGGDAVEEELRPAIIGQASEEDRVVELQWSAYTRARDAGHLDYVRDARKFDDYYYGKHWEDDVKNALEAQKRPAHTVNLVLSTVNAVVGEYIRSRQDISFQPMGKGANAETAKALRFLFKQIAINNDSDQKEKTVFTDGLIQDRGYFYYSLDFSDNLAGEIREEVFDPTDIILDPGAKEYDPRTWAEVFISRWLTPEEIGATYGEEFKDKVDLAAAAGTFGHDSLEWEAPNFSGNHYNSEVFFQISQEDVKRVKRVRVIERQYKRLTRTAFFVDRETADTRRVPEGWSSDRAVQFAAQHDLGLIWKPERRVRVVVTADRVLLRDHWSLFNQISLIPFFPYFRRGRPFGLVRNLISPQDMLNKVTSQELHVVNTSANSGWVFESGSLINMDRDDLEQQGAKTGLVLEYAKGSEAPEKIQPNQVPTGLNEISAKAAIYFREIGGVNEAMLGTQRSDSSKALDSRKQGGLIQQEIIFDNLELTRRYRARFMLDIVQSYYSDTRLVQVFEKNEDGDDVQTEMAVNQIEETVDPETQQVTEEIVNDLTLGEYGLAITSIPRRDTYDESLFEQLTQLREAGVQIPDFVMIESSAHPDRKELSELIKQIQGMAAPTEEEIERAQILDDLQFRLLSAQVMETEAQAKERMANAEKLLAHGRNLDAQPETERLKLGTQARVELEKASMEHQANQEDLLTRIQLMRQKTGSAERVSQIQSMTKRTEAGLNRRASLEKELIALRNKPSERPAAKG